MTYDHHLEMSQPSWAASMSIKWKTCLSFWQKHKLHNPQRKVWPLWQTWWSTCSSQPAWQSQNSLWRAWSGQTGPERWTTLDRWTWGWILSPSAVFQCSTSVGKQNDSEMHAQCDVFFCFEPELTRANWHEVTLVINSIRAFCSDTQWMRKFSQRQVAPSLKTCFGSSAQVVLARAGRTSGGDFRSTGIYRDAGQMWCTFNLKNCPTLWSKYSF